jgi:hypothetical protein
MTDKSMLVLTVEKTGERYEIHAPELSIFNAMLITHRHCGIPDDPFRPLLRGFHWDCNRETAMAMDIEAIKGQTILTVSKADDGYPTRTFHGVPIEIHD